MVRGKRPRIGIYGSYGGWNTGDEAILLSIVRQLRRSAEVDLTVFTRSAAHTRRLHHVDHVVEVREMTREESQLALQDLDLLVLGGGGILYDEEAAVYLREVALAHERRLPVMVYAVGVGPLRDPRNRELVAKHLSGVRALTVRDRESLKILQEAGVQREIRLTADPALLLEPEPLPPDALIGEGLATKRRVVGFSVREPGGAAPEMSVDHYRALLANTADFMIDRLGATVVFVPMERRNDTRHAHAVMAQMHSPERATVLRGDYSPGQLLSLIGHMQFCLGMRLHFLLFSALKGVPFVALPYASKVLGLINELEMPMPPLADVTVGRLLAHVDYSWDAQEEICGRIERRLPALIERARQTNRILTDLIYELDRA